jgi:hypothetical protein
MGKQTDGAIQIKGMMEKVPADAIVPVMPSKAMQKMKDRIRRHSLEIHIPLGDTCGGGGCDSPVSIATT